MLQCGWTESCRRNESFRFFILFYKETEALRMQGDSSDIIWSWKKGGGAYQFKPLLIHYSQAPFTEHCFVGAGKKNLKVLIWWFFILIYVYMHAQLLSHVRLFGTPWTVAYQAPLYMGFSQQEYWSGCRLFLQRIFPTQGSNPCVLCLLHWQADSLSLCHLGSPLCMYVYKMYIYLLIYVYKYVYIYIKYIIYMYFQNGYFGACNSKGGCLSTFSYPSPEAGGEHSCYNLVS